jgi:hypothetical protein
MPTPQRVSSPGAVAVTNSLSSASAVEDLLTQVLVSAPPGAIARVWWPAVKLY